MRRNEPIRVPEVRGALDAFRRIVQALRVASRDAEQRLGISGAQLFALQRIAEYPGASVNEIAALTFTHQSSVSVVIQRLVQQGLVAKIRVSDDRRRQELTLTPKGHRVMQRAPSAMQERLIAAIASLRPGDRRSLARSLERVALFVAPDIEHAHAPMLFEERSARRTKRK